MLVITVNYLKTRQKRRHNLIVTCKGFFNVTTWHVDFVGENVKSGIENFNSV